MKYEIRKESNKITVKASVKHRNRVKDPIESIDTKKILDLLTKEGQTEINLIINNKNEKIYYNLQKPRKFDLNQLKMMKSKDYVKKITI